VFHKKTYFVFLIHSNDDQFTENFNSNVAEEILIQNI